MCVGPGQVGEGLQEVRQLPAQPALVEVSELDHNQGLSVLLQLAHLMLFDSTKKLAKIRYATQILRFAKMKKSFISSSKYLLLRKVFKKILTAMIFFYFF